MNVEMWDEITDIIGVELAANLFNKSDCDQVACLMGDSWELCSKKNTSMHDDFIICVSSYYSQIYDLLQAQFKET